MIKNASKSQISSTEIIIESIKTSYSILKELVKSNKILLIGLLLCCLSVHFASTDEITYFLVGDAYQLGPDKAKLVMSSGFIKIIDLIISVVFYTIALSTAVYCHQRIILGKPYSTNLIKFLTDNRLWGYIVVGIIMVILVSILTLPAMALFGIAAVFLAPLATIILSNTLTTILAVLVLAPIFFYIVCYIGLKFAFLLPMAAAGHEISISKSWRLAKGKTWIYVGWTVKSMLIFLIINIPAIGFALLPIEFPLNFPRVAISLLIIFDNLLFIIETIFIACSLSYAYTRLIPKEENTA